MTMFLIPIVIAAPMMYGLARGFGTSLLVPTLGLLVLAVILGTLTVWLARRVLEPAERIEEARRILEDAYDRARSEALRDSLSGLGNHRAFQEEMERAWATATRHNQSLALAIVDLDDFKKINDSRGHAVGDSVIRTAGATIATYLRRSDRAFRIGGDEFAIIMPGTDADKAHAAVRRLLAACLDDMVDGDPMAISFSAGCQRDPGSGTRSRLALRPGRRGADLGQAARPDVRDDLRRRASPRDRRQPQAGRAVRARRAGRRDRRDPARSSSRSTT